MENIDILREIVVELDRFKKKLVLAVKEQDVKERRIVNTNIQNNY